MYLHFKQTQHMKSHIYQGASWGWSYFITPVLLPFLLFLQMGELFSYIHKMIHLNPQLNLITKRYLNTCCAPSFLADTLCVVISGVSAVEAGSRLTETGLLFSRMRQSRGRQGGH